MRLYFALCPQDLNIDKPCPLAVFAPTDDLCQKLGLPLGTKKGDDLEEAEFWAAHFASVISLRSQKGSSPCRVVAVGDAKDQDLHSSHREKLSLLNGTKAVHGDHIEAISPDLPGLISASSTSLFTLSWSEISCFYIDEAQSIQKLLVYRNLPNDELTEVEAPAMLWFDISERQQAYMQIVSQFTQQE